MAALIPPTCCNYLRVTILPTDWTSNGFTGSQAKDVDLTGWELALVSTPGTDISSFKERQLGGGLDSVTLNSLYDEGAYKAAQQPVYEAPAPNPFETGDLFVTGPQTGAVVPHESNPFGPFEP
nr:putative clathrin assembly protein At2g01600 [Tanacetum cinerariifolium]